MKPGGYHVYEEMWMGPRTDLKASRALDATLPRDPVPMHVVLP